MEKEKNLSFITNSLSKLDLNTGSDFKPTTTTIFPSQFSRKAPKKKRLGSLVSLCLGLIGKYLEDIISDLAEVAVNFPADIRMVMAAIARRRKLLNDDVIVSLPDSSWEILDISGSDVSDIGLAKVAEIYKSLKAADIRGCPRSDHTARRCLGIFKPKLNDVEGDSWEEVDTAEIVNGAESLQWLVWPKIDKNTMESFSTECLWIIVNSKPDPFGFRGTKVPREALPDIALDEPVVEDIDRETWAFRGSIRRATPPQLSSPMELSISEKFRLAFVDRDTKFALKRAKNARQHQWRAEREWIMMDASQGTCPGLTSEQVLVLSELVRFI